MVCENIKHIKRLVFYFRLFLLVFSSCELRLASYDLETVGNMLRVLLCTLLSFSRINCVGVARIVRPHSDE